VAEPTAIGLVCPGCRRLEGGQLVVSALQAGPLGLVCPGCGRDHPVVDGVPIVLADLDAWLQSEGPALLRRSDLEPPLLERLCLGAGGVLARDMARVQTYLDASDSPLQRWARSLLDESGGPALDPSGSAALDPSGSAALDLGCGVGSGDERVLGLDLHWASLQKARGPVVLADALNPPFLARSFELVLALNLLDSCRDPGLMLQQALALVAPGGRLALASPFHWQESVTPRSLWLRPEQVEDFLRAQSVELTRGEAEWSLSLGPRSEIRHRCVTWLVRLAH